MFWSSVDLTGNQTYMLATSCRDPFWSSVDLTGNQTKRFIHSRTCVFWSSVDLTGNQTALRIGEALYSFGAVSI